MEGIDQESSSPPPPPRLKSAGALRSGIQEVLGSGHLGLSESWAPVIFEEETDDLRMDGMGMNGVSMGIYGYLWVSMGIYGYLGIRFSERTLQGPEPIWHPQPQDILGDEAN